MSHRKPLSYYLKLHYPFHAVAEQSGRWTIVFPDLPGCLSMAESVEEIGPSAEEARQLWIETAYEAGHPIPEPSLPSR